MFKIFLFLIFIATQSFAGAASDSNYITDFGIYVYGDVRSIENAFIMVQSIVTSDMLPWILTMIAMFLLPYSAYDYFKTQDFTKFAANLTFMSVSLLSFDTTHLGATVHIEDLRTLTNASGLPAKTYAVVDDIPYPIAFITSTVSTIVDGIERTYEDAIQLVNVNNGLDINGISDKSVGFMGGIGDILKITKMASFSLDSNLSEFGRATQAYINDCVIAQAVTANPKLITTLKTPNVDVFDSISPTNLGFGDDNPKITYDGNQTSCKDFYNNHISANYSTAAQNLMAKLNKDTNGNLSDTTYTDSLVAIGADANTSFIANNVGKFQAYMMNVAALAPISNAFRNYLTNVDSGQDVANAITAGASIASLQSEGAGKFKWMAQMIPMGFHYMLGIIYSISILIMIVATALGYQRGMMIWKNFAKGLLTFEFIKVALVIVNSTVNQYTAMHAADFLASVGQNPASISAIPQYINYIASMAGVAGMLGVAAIFMIPGMVFSGEVAMAAGVISGLASRYKGNDIQTATSESAQQKAQNAAWENELRDQARLDHMGVSVPAGMGATQFYSEYQKDAQTANAGFGAARMGTGALDSAGHAVKGQTMQNISAMSTLDHNATMDDFVSAGVGQGAMMAGDVTGTANAVNSYGNSAVDKIKAGKSAMTAKSIGNTVGYGEEVNDDDAIAFGELGGKTMGAADKGTYEGAVAGGIDNFLKGTEDQAAKKSSVTASYGKTTSMKSAIDAGKFTGIEIGAADNELASDPNLEGDARTSGKLGIDKKLQSIHGAQKAQIYNKDGSDGKEHDKFMLGGTELARQALNNKELAMGLAMNKKSEEEKRQMYADMQAAGSLKTLDEFSKVKGARKTGSFTHDKDGYLETASNENDVTWRDTNGKTHTMSRAKANELLGDAEQRGILGKGAGISSKTDGGRNMGILSNNAMGQEAGNISGMNAAIAVAGGVTGFSALKATQSAVQTTEAASTVKSKIEEGLLHSGQAKTPEEAKKLAEAIVNGSAEGADKFKKALESLGNLAGAKVGGQTRADYTSQAIAGGSEKYKELQADTASMKTAQSMKSIKAQKEAGFMDENGNITSKGMEAYGVVAGQQASHLSKLLDFANDPKGLEKIRNKMNSDEPGSGDEWIAPFMNGNKIKTGQDLLNAMSAQKATVFMASNAIAGGGAKVFTGAIDQNSVSGKVSGGLGIVNDTTSVKKSGKSSIFDDATKINTGVQIKGTTLDPAAWAEVTGKMISKHGFQAVEGAIADAKNGNFDNFRKFAKDTFGDENGDEIANNLQVQWQQDPKTGSNRLGEFLFAGVATYGAYKMDKKFNPELDVEGKKTGRGNFFGKIQDRGRSIKESVLGTSSTIKSEQSTNESDNSQPNKTNQEKTNDLHDDSFTKNMSNDNIKSSENKAPSGNKTPPSGYKTTDSGIIVPEDTKIHTKEPAPHMSHVGKEESGFAHILEEVSHIPKVGKAIAGAAALFTGTELMGAKTQTDVGAILDPAFASSMGDGTLKMFNPNNTNPSKTPQIMTFNSKGNLAPVSSAASNSIFQQQGGGGEDLFNSSAFMQNIRSSVQTGSYQSIKAGQIASRNVGMSEELRENFEYSNENFQDQLGDIMDRIEDMSDGYL